MNSDVFTIRTTIAEHLGTTVLVTGETLDGETIRAVLPEDAEPAPGTKLNLRPALNRVLVYSSETTLLLP
jgi:hypothetical protein